MSQSATAATGASATAVVTAHSITGAARRLADAHGFDGFTMDDLAREAGVSRRTLFNHVAGKVEAVLGPPAEPAPESLEKFRAGGPHGRLLLDLADLAESILGARGLDSDELGRAQRLLKANPRLLAATHGRFLQLTERLVSEIAVREGATFDEPRARIAVALIASLFQTSLDAYLAEPGGRSLVQHFHEGFRLARGLFACPG